METDIGAAMASLGMGPEELARRMTRLLPYRVCAQEAADIASGRPTTPRQKRVAADAERLLAATTRA